MCTDQAGHFIDAEMCHACQLVGMYDLVSPCNTSACLSADLSSYLSICLSVCLSLYRCPFAHSYKYNLKILDFFTLDPFPKEVENLQTKINNDKNPQ